MRYYRYGRDGLYFRHANDPDKADRLELPLPVSAGMKWLMGATEVQAERAGAVIAGGREYRDCLKVIYREANGPRSTENYYAPGVGIIKTVYINMIPPQSTAELVLENFYL